MRIQIITSCTGEKVHSPDNQLSLMDFRKGPDHVKAREKQLKPLLTPAGKLYSGEQHVRLMRGVQIIREKEIQCHIDILSAGYGFIPEEQIIAPYECTFANMKTQALKDWSAHLKSPEGFRSAVSAPYDFALILLGDNYLKACALDAKVKLGGPTLLFAGQRSAKKLPRIPNLRVVTLSNAEAKRFSCGLVGLKGELANRLLKEIAADPGLVQRLKDPATDVLALMDCAASNSGKIFAKSSTRVNSKVDHVIAIPQLWRDKPHQNEFRYFIPEWNDLVDPDYDFINDQHSSGGADWTNEVYAHQIYPEPNYDGILVSRAVAEKTKKKKDRINALGVHRFLRLPRDFPIMGDCGAFDYIMQDTPPYTTEDVIDYYSRLDFDYGVSVDHLIVAATESQKKFRYDLTIHNAAEFIKEHRKRKLEWVPIGAVQGWDPLSYAEAAAKYVKMGYNYIGLGGLIRTKSSDIIDIVKEVRKVIPSSVRIHLFGVVRLNALKELVSIGVQSADSASYLRQAWMRLLQSYASLEGPYSALRIPQAGKSFRAKQIERHAGLTDEDIIRLEKSALNSVHAFDRRQCSLSECLESLLAYDKLVTAKRVDMTEHYRRILTDRPWEKCGCEVCQTWGIEVAVFRGNNRNRRRGFHNTYVFYRLMQQVLRGEIPSFLKSSRDVPGKLHSSSIPGAK